MPKLCYSLLHPVLPGCISCSTSSATRASASLLFKPANTVRLPLLCHSLANFRIFSTSYLFFPRVNSSCVLLIYLLSPNSLCIVCISLLMSCHMEVSAGFQGWLLFFLQWAAEQCWGNDKDLLVLDEKLERELWPLPVITKCLCVYFGLCFCASLQPFV